MPLVKVYGTDIAYEAYGNGETVFWLQAPWFGKSYGAYYVAGRLSKNYRTIIWDGPNTGQSDFAIESSISEWHQTCKYIYQFCKQIGEKSVCFAGGSGGGELALLMAHLYPDLVEGVIMYRPTDSTSDIEKEIIEKRYLDIAKVAKIKRMNDVIKYSEKPTASRFSNMSQWIFNLSRNEQMRDNLLAFDPIFFSEIMRSWGDWMGNPLFYRANLSDEELSMIKIPVLIYAAPDRHHPLELAIDLNAKLPNSTIDRNANYRNDDEIYNGQGEEHNFGEFVSFVNSMEAFLDSISKR